MKDRIPTKPGQVQLIPSEDGDDLFVIERADEILEEYEGILNLPVLRIPKEVSIAILSKFQEDGINPGRTSSNEEYPDPTDQVFYEISLSVEDAYMVTNNKKHFPQKPRVVTPSEMLFLLTEAGII